MKRSLATALVISLILTVLLVGLHALGLIGGFERAVLGFFTRHRAPLHTVGVLWQAIIVFALSFLVAWLTFMSRRRSRIALITLVLFLEILGVAWICGLYRVGFQPLPSLIAVALAFVAAERWAV